jgi:hypothetical protein
MSQTLPGTLPGDLLLDGQSDGQSSSTKHSNHNHHPSTTTSTTSQSLSDEEERFVQLALEKIYPDEEEEEKDELEIILPGEVTSILRKIRFPIRLYQKFFELLTVMEGLKCTAAEVERKRVEQAQRDELKNRVVAITPLEIDKLQKESKKLLEETNSLRAQEERTKREHRFCAGWAVVFAAVLTGSAMVGAVFLEFVFK